MKKIVAWTIRNSIIAARKSVPATKNATKKACSKTKSFLAECKDVAKDAWNEDLDSNNQQ